MKSFLQFSAKYIAFAITAIIVFSVCLFIWGVWHDEWSGYNASLSISDGYCNIAVIPIVGDITTFSYQGNEADDPAEIPYTNADDVVALLQQAEHDSYVTGVLVRIDSSGGYSVASEIIANALKRFPYPSIALIREAGTSGAYLAATGADAIVASSFSDVGSIGVTMSYLDNTAKNVKDGLKYVPLTSAKFKDYGDPNKPLTADERVLLERDLKIYHDQFIKEVVENRNLPIEQVAKLADGSSMPGALALENKLIDALGDQEKTREWFAGALELPLEEVVFCE